ncbi:eamA-like transporter family protein [Chlamydia ibidis]|uniref:EamA-like transporter family protein n=2 Tax=Chlamydia ibidis TaxID=1405396 RepID=S7J4S6_9CHLA|nr:DMT family transporter [Chlamydia ibidis]EPP35047.1 eamA-like transporter family protein [Chlamydia ibidis]EQM62795.1 eamA-like transporter family protein [Chlamydia ibidis 10-1398/6]
MFLGNTQAGQNRNTTVGIFYSLVACLYWGIVFVIPDLLSSFQELDIVLARYSVFGLFSLTPLLWKRENIFKNISSKIWRKSLLWAFLINIIYYLGIALAIRYSGGSVTIIIAGLAPIAILFHANFRKKTVSNSYLAFISLIIFFGVVLTNISGFQAATESNLLQYCFGLFCVTFSTLIWVGYIVCNHSFLDTNPDVSPETWCKMLGISSLVLCLPLIIVLDTLGITSVAKNIIVHTPSHERFLFVILCAIMGIFSSSKAITAWNKASLHLSPALLGALLIFEPIFGLTLSYLYKKTLPTIQESLGIFLMLGGSLSCLILFGRKNIHNLEEKKETSTSLEQP